LRRRRLRGNLDGSSRVTIRGMQLSDVPIVTRYEKQLFSDPWPVQIFREDIASPFSYPFVAEVDDEIVGYAILWVGADEGHLTNIAVAEKFQRKSVAKRLLTYILQLAASLELAQIILEVRPSNVPAIRLYEAYGFERLATRKDYYKNPVEDCLVMRKLIWGGDVE
jgi:ribosomal-protein-alanine N-acetyltransferase